MTEKMKVLFLAAEAAPFIKIGGLADVAGALPRALRKLPKQPDVRLALPLHKQIDLTRLPRKQVASFEIEHSSGPLPATVYETVLEGMPVYLIDGPPFQEAAQVYSSDAQTDGYKYTFFSLAALELCKQLQWAPDVVHANDWHTAPAIYALKTIMKYDLFFAMTRTLITIHNLPYLGNGAGPALREFGLQPAEGTPLPWWAQDMPLPMGLLTADKINTVSEGYAHEILTEPYGSGLHEFLATRLPDLSGIPNGLDIERWNPATDPALKENYNSAGLMPRKTNKLALLKELDLQPNLKPALLAFIGRMDRQKGVDIAIEALRKVADLPWQAVILGSGDSEIEGWVRSLAHDYPNRVHAAIRYDEGLSRRILGGADFMLIPSRYEPCGLIQMSAMRYGCVPVARATGGLKDTIIDYHAGPSSTGFLFEQTSPEAMADALRRALAVYDDRRRWPYLQKRGMRRDFSWDRSALQYFKLYTKMQKSVKK